MRFVTFRRARAPEPGVVIGDKAISLEGAGFPDLLSVIAGGARALDRVNEWTAHPPEQAVADLSSVKLMAPIPKPPKTICVGLNWRDHAAESGLEIPEVPTIFSKFSTAVIGPGDNIVLPKSSRKP